jgi:superfamily II DNA or RNA helicase
MANPNVNKNSILGLIEVEDWKQLGEMGISPPWGNWHDQYNACCFVEKYLSSNKRSGVHQNAGLVRMPTGTGKTGIMAVAANFILDKENILIVAPSQYLTVQIQRALEFGFWMRLGKRPHQGPKQAKIFVPSTLKKHLDATAKPTIFICTTQCLQDIYDHQEKWPDLYKHLRERVSVILVDEGHREPARTWAKAVRSFGCPTILFSATPYRNDLRMFRIGRGEEYRYSIRYHQSVALGVIRDVKFRYPIQSFFDTRTGKRNPAKFVSSLLAYYYGQLQSEKPNDISQPKVIIRCKSFDSIRVIYNTLLDAETKRHGKIEAQKRVLAIHENFELNKSANQYDIVPRSGSILESAVFWIHQYKLTEGIDYPAFCCVAFFEPFDNSRSLIQQIGRILRNPSGKRGCAGFVFSDLSDNLENQWNGYIEFERSPQDIIGSADIVEAIRNSQPKWYYASGRYRTGADFDSDQLWEDIRLPATAVVYIRPNNFEFRDLTKIAELVSELMEDRELVHIRNIEKAHGNNRYSIAIFHWEVVQSDHLEEGGFFDIRLIVSYLYMNKQHIFFQGRINLSGPEIVPRLGRIDINHLEKLIPSRDVKIKQLSLVNCDLGDSAIRRKALGGRSLADSAASLNDHLHFVSSLVCHDGTRPRYIGLRKSTVTDRGSYLLNLDEFRGWADKLTERIVAGGSSEHRVLRRYARAVRAPEEAKARHLLLDLADFKEEFGPINMDKEVIFSEEFAAAACDVNDDGTFSCEILGHPIDGTIRYSGGRFLITSASLNNSFISRYGKKRTASTFISSATIMSVVTDNGLIYSDGRFYNVSRLHGSDRAHDLDIIVSVPGLENIACGEKGEKGVFAKDTWQTGSLFHAIDKNEVLYKKCGFTPQILICDDMGPEIADFLAIDLKKKKIALIHAKAFKKGEHISAKAMQEIIAQAKKNLGFLDPAESIGTSRARKWDGKWKWSKNSHKGLKRIRKTVKGLDSGQAILEKIQQLLHSTDTQKEVWLVLGNAFSKEEIKKVVLSDTDIPYHWTQLLYLIHSCLASVTTFGARLRIVTGFNADI